MPTGGVNRVPDPAVQPNPDARSNANPGRNVAPTVLSAVSGTRRTDQDPCCDSLVRTDIAARQRSVVLSYLETLLQHAQSAMCKNSPEGYAVAKLRLDTLSQFLGRRPRTIYGQDDGQNPQTVAAFVPRLPPLNPRLMEIYDNVADQLDALHQCLTKARLKSGVLHLDTSFGVTIPYDADGRPRLRTVWTTVAAARQAPIASSFSSNAHWKRQARCVRLVLN